MEYISSRVYVICKADVLSSDNKGAKRTCLSRKNPKVEGEAGVLNGQNAL